MDILVVDDKKSVQEMLYRLLTSQGHSVDLAMNGLDALGKAQQGNYQVFIIDHLMPLMNGLQLTKNLKKNADTANKKIIFMTTQDVNTLKNLPEYPLFNEVIDKPINQDDFLAVLSKLTDFDVSCDTLETTR